MSASEVSTRLSYSSASLLSSCEQRYVHYKVKETEPDIDAEVDTKAFMLGKAFHHVLEMNNHSKNNIHDLVLEAQERYLLSDQEAFQIHAMVHNYLDLHLASGLEVVKCEYAIVDKCFIGYVDVVMKDAEGNWYICDLKTAARLAPDLAQRMSKDTQLNLYTAYRGAIADDLGLDVSKFKGCLYRVTTKVKIKLGKRETPKEYIKRCYDRVDTVEYFVKLEDMKPEEFMERHMIQHKRSMELREGAKPLKNYKACYDFWKPCPYYEKCHGKVFSEADTLTEVRRAEDF
jgi:hypothetical protein